MRQALGTITVQTRRQGNTDISRDIAQWVEDQGMATGLLTVFLQHVSAHLSLQEHSDRDDLYTFFSRMERDPAGFGEFTSAVTSVSLNIPVTHGRMALGARQRLYLYEHRETPQSRSMVLHLVGD
ncbi:MAG: YjbQ family protein [Rhodospirillaceae bacterium]|nr:YjbQ family protein [Rhodospirillales bacterium]